MRNMTVPQMIVYVLLFIVLASFITALAKQWITIPVVTQIAQAIADIITAAAKSSAA